MANIRFRKAKLWDSNTQTNVNEADEPHDWLHNECGKLVDLGHVFAPRILSSLRDIYEFFVLLGEFNQRLLMTVPYSDRYDIAIDFSENGDALALTVSQIAERYPTNIPAHLVNTPAAAVCNNMKHSKFEAELLSMLLIEFLEVRHGLRHIDIFNDPRCRVISL